MLWTSPSVASPQPVVGIKPIAWSLQTVHSTSSRQRLAPNRHLDFLLHDCFLGVSVTTATVPSTHFTSQTTERDHPLTVTSRFIEVEAIRRGDRVAFERIFRSHYAELCEFAYRYVADLDRSEEIVQDVFVRIWELREEWNVQSSIRSYLFGAVRNRCLNDAKHQQVERNFRERATYEPSVSPHSMTTGIVDDTEYDTTPHKSAIRAAIARLPERRRTAVMLRWFKQMSYKQIAETMEISVKGVEQLLSKALKDLRRLM